MKPLFVEEGERTGLNEIDLHCHTTASDGALGPTQLVQRAGRLAVRVIAITDHDSTEGVAQAIEAGQELGVEVIPGVEINTDVPGGEVHVLGYFVDATNPELSAELRRLRAGRLGRARTIVATLGELGAPVSFERVLEIAGDGSVGRPHVARALVEAGHVSTYGEAFERYIGREAPAYVPRLKFAPAEACSLIRRAHGIAVFAHPISFAPGGVMRNAVDLDRAIPELIEAGLMGLEVYYPGYDALTVEYLLGLARKHNLLVTGGSDFHGTQSDRADLGSVYVPRKVVRRLYAAREQLDHGI